LFKSDIQLPINNKIQKIKCENGDLKNTVY